LIRIFFTLAVFSLICVVVALIVGIYVGDLHNVLEPETSPSLRQTTIERASVHRRIGVAAAIVVIFANSLAVTYFIGTGRWCKEVVTSYSLSPELLQRSVALKRRTFPWAVSSMLLIVGVVALGAAADPGTGMQDTAEWVLPHFLGSLTAVAFLVLSFFVQGSNIRAHYEVINEIMAEVRRVRVERGMAV
jgi:hypothetical protein